MVFLLSPQNIKSVAVACAPEDTPASYNLISQLEGLTSLPFELTLKDIIFNKNGSKELSELGRLKYLWFDYQPNSLAWPIFSERLKNLIDSQAVGEKLFEWINVKIRQNNKTARQYYLLRFKAQQDVIDLNQSVFTGENADILVRPVFDSKKINNLPIFCAGEYFWQITSGIYVTKNIKDAAKKQGLVGLNFESARTV